MSKVRIDCFALSLEGYGAGLNQDLQHPLGVHGERLHGWFRPTRTFVAMMGGKGGTTGIDDAFAKASMENVGAWIMGRNMFGPVRGPWRDDPWKGWWGDEPPYHCPVFVLTHHARSPIEMKGGTTFHFVTEGPEEALKRARAAAGARDVRVGGGVDTARQYLRAGLVDRVHLTTSPVLLGAGESLFAGIDLDRLGYTVVEQKASEQTLHVVLERGQPKA